MAMFLQQRVALEASLKQTTLQVLSVLRFASDRFLGAVLAVPQFRMQ